MASISPGGAYMYMYHHADMCLTPLHHSMARFLRADDLKRHVRTVHSKDVDNQLCVPSLYCVYDGLPLTLPT